MGKYGLFKKNFNELARICADAAGLHEVVFLVEFKTDWDDDVYDGKLVRTDYTHMIANIEIRAEHAAERLYGDPDAFSSFLLHEMLHYATGAGSYEFEKNKEFYFGRFGHDNWTHAYNAILANEEQSTVRLERSIAGFMHATPEYKTWKKNLPKA